MQQKLLLLSGLLFHSARSFVQLQPLVTKHLVACMSESTSTDEATAADHTANKDPELFVNGLTHDSKPGHAKFTRLLYKTLPLQVQHSARNNGGVRSLMDNGVTLSVSLMIRIACQCVASTI